MTYSSDNTQQKKDLIQSVVDELNSALELDRTALTCLFSSLTACSISLGNSDIEIIPISISDGTFAVGTLGIINAIVKASGSEHRIACVCGEHGLIDRFFIHKSVLVDTNE